jgi:hypothetical protein
VRRSRPETVLFTFGDRRTVVDAMAAIAAGGGWITLQPGFDPDLVAEVSGSSSPPRSAVAVCTWVPGERSRRHGEHVALGIEHGAGSRVATRLAEEGVGVPEAWELVQDDARRGLVVAARAVDPHADVLDWLLRAGVALSSAPLTGEWRALLHRR